MVQAGMSLKQDSISKVINAKKAGRMAQAIKCVPLLTQVVKCLLSTRCTKFNSQYHQNKNLDIRPLFPF
jgi:hypothetical protein